MSDNWGCKHIQPHTLELLTPITHDLLTISFKELITISAKNLWGIYDLTSSNNHLTLLLYHTSPSLNLSSSSMARTRNCIWYSSATLKRIRSSAKSVSNYGFFHINTPIRAWIIALGIRARPSTFRRSRAGRNLFYHIASITYRWHCNLTHRSPTTPVHTVNQYNLLLNKTINNCSKLQSPVLPAPQKDLHSALINCRSVVNKTQDIQLELVLNNLDLCILTETWIKEDDTTTPSRLCPSGYKALSISRHGRIGGGIATVYENDLNISTTRGQPFKTMESTCFSINTGNKVINLIATYRPPDSNVL